MKQEQEQQQSQVELSYQLSAGNAIFQGTINPAIVVATNTALQQQHSPALQEIDQQQQNSMENVGILATIQTNRKNKTIKNLSVSKDPKKTK